VAAALVRSSGLRTSWRSSRTAVDLPGFDGESLVVE
jgi:hypothetical protein